VSPSYFTAIVRRYGGSAKAFGRCSYWCYVDAPDFLAPEGVDMILPGGESISQISIYGESPNEGPYTGTYACSSSGRLFLAGYAKFYGSETNTIISSPTDPGILPPGEFCKKVVAGPGATSLLITRSSRISRCLQPKLILFNSNFEPSQNPGNCTRTEIGAVHCRAFCSAPLLSLETPQMCFEWTQIFGMDLPWFNSSS
jgi:hypothetical protein